VELNLKNASRFFGALIFAFASTHASAYKISGGGKEQGFYIFDVTTTAPVTVLNGLSPQQAIDAKCPGGKVTEVNLATRSNSCNYATSVQVVFLMPDGGCQKKK
jgi:hypothetical protein